MMYITDAQGRLYSYNTGSFSYAVSYVPSLIPHADLWTHPAR